MLLLIYFCLNTKIPQNYKIYCGIHQTDVTAGKNKTVALCTLPSGWSTIDGVIAIGNFNPYSYSIDVYGMVNSDKKGTTCVIAEPSASVTVTIAYIIFGN